ncbi:hypothetical protein [Actinophytocola xanthii]|uniref:Uncharacterized protein n=1 Tax=Actinophytocola xanthii TaxID=1912961 RepID=A0A1Q8CR46_9PSEU|nr:hypothetical protein [Actinophytocola xanthii]OLF16813.1 hypothetical protein BU204_15240 [Actinophytocola xanthii]
MATTDDEDPTRAFLDQTVPRDDAWEGREPDDGPARPRHLQHPTEQDTVHAAKERRRATVKNVAWAAAPGAAFLAGAATAPDPEPEPEVDVADGVGDIGSAL